MGQGPGSEFEDEMGEGAGPTRDVLRSMWRPLREFLVEGCRVSVPGHENPLEVRIARYMEADERREAFLLCQDKEAEDQHWMLLIYPHALETERTLAQVVDGLSQPEVLGSRDAAWRVIRACEHAAGFERETWVDAKAQESAEVRAFLGERTQALRQLQAADEQKEARLLPAKAPQAGRSAEARKNASRKHKALMPEIKGRKKKG